MGKPKEDKLKNIDYIRTVSDLNDLDLEQRTYIAGIVKGMFLQKNLSMQKES